MTSELLPCPFCGSEAWVVPIGPLAARVECQDCDAMVVGHTRDRAITAWNTRAEASQAEVERLTRERDEARGHRLKDEDWPLALHRLRHCEPGPDQGLTVVGMEDLAFALQQLSEFASVAMGNAAEVGRLGRERDEARSGIPLFGVATGDYAVAVRRGDLAEARATRAEGLLEALANAADVVGVAYFDSDDLSPEVEAMQSATLAARAFLDKLQGAGQ